MSDAAHQIDRSPPRLHWFRYNLRLLLLLTTAIAGVMGFLTYRARVQEQAVEVIRHAGGTVHFDYMNVSLRTISTAGKPREPAWLRNWLGEHYFDTAVWVSLQGTPQNDRWISAVNDLPALNTLLLSGENITDATLARLRSTTTLKELHLSGGRFTADGLSNLKRFPKLRWLVLNHSAITDEGLIHVTGLKHLEELILHHTTVSDVGIDSIASMSNLQKLDIRKTAITAEKFEQALPNCKVLW